MDRRESIFNWNHVSEKLTENQISELKALYKFYHKKYWLAKMTYKYFKKTELACNIGSALLVANRNNSWWCNTKPYSSWSDIRYWALT